MTLILPRRKFFSLLAAPLIVSAANIMPVKVLRQHNARWAYRFSPVEGLAHFDGIWIGLGISTHEKQTGEILDYPDGRYVVTACWASPARSLAEFRRAAGHDPTTPSPTMGS